MTVDEAAKQWVKAKRAIRAAEPGLKASAKILKEHFKKTGKTSYGKIGFSVTPYTGFDLEAARAELGKKLDKFDVVRTRETLSLLGDG